MNRSWLIIFVVGIAVAAIAIAIRRQDLAPTADATTTTTTTIGITSSSAPAPQTPACDPYETIVTAGAVESSALFETSGIAASRTAPGVIWAHNDSGDEPTVYAVGPNGEDLGSFTVGGGLAFDWEDLAVGPGPEPGRTYLYVGDIGDNLGIRQGRITVYVVPEPDPTALPDVIPVERSIVLNTPDGPHDFESLFVADGVIYLVTKDAEVTGVYRGVLPAEGGTATSLELVATLDLGAEVTAADVSWDGSIIAFRGYDNVWLWHREPWSSVDEALTAAPCTAPSPTEIQGEALTFLDDGSVVTIPEGEHPPIHVIARFP